MIKLDCYADCLERFYVHQANSPARPRFDCNIFSNKIAICQSSDKTV